jgi:SAM-dependent methyltransferase
VAVSPVDERAAVGFDRAGADYERGRPGYPEPAVSTMVRELGLEPGRTVVDLAAGTGKLTRLLLASGARVIAVEPVAGMRAELVRNVPQVEILEGTAELMPLPDGTADAVTVAQAFHWFNAAAAAREIHRVLRPQGALAVIWNSWDESVPWVAALQAIVHERAGDAPRQASSAWQRELSASGLFTPLSERAFTHVVPGNLGTVIARVASISYIAALEPDEHRRVLARVRRVLESDPATAGRERIEMPYGTHLVWGRRREVGSGPPRGRRHDAHSSAHRR